MIQNLCQKIKDKRKELGYSIEEVVKQTKLHPSVIKDIENCSFENITPIYIKGFIKIYASFLGIEVKDELEQIKKTPSPRIRKPEKKERKENAILVFFRALCRIFSKIPPAARKNILLGIVVLVFLWLGFLGVRISFRKALEFFQKPSPASEKEETSPEKETTLAEPVGQAEQIDVSLTVKKPCYIRVSADGRVVFEGRLSKGEIETWQADEEIEFKISDGSAVYLEIDGRPIPKLSSIHKPIKSLIINSSGITVKK